MAPEWGNN